MKNDVKWFIVDIEKGKEKYHINNIISVVMDANFGIFLMRENPEIFSKNKTIAILKDDGDLYLYKRAKNKIGFKMTGFEITELKEDYDNPMLLNSFLCAA